MRELLDRTSSEPYYLQLKTILRDRLHLYEDKRLPPVRQVAQDFGVSVNTVLRAYHELKRDGIITGEVGRGTFVTTTKDLLEDSRMAVVSHMLQHALEEAVSLGFTLDEFQTVANEVVAGQRRAFSAIRIVVVECNPEQLVYVSRHLELDPSIKPLTLLLGDLREGNHEDDLFDRCDLVLTSFQHVDEVEELLGDIDRPVIAVNLEPETSSVIEVARTPKDVVLGLVTESERFRDIVLGTLKDLDLRFDEVRPTTASDTAGLHHDLEGCGAVIVSPEKRQAVESAVPASTRVVEFAFGPDRTSLNNIKVAVLELHGQLPGRATGKE